MNGKTEHMNGGMESPDKEVNGEKEEQTDKDGEKESDENKDQEVLLIQDTGFNVTITCPGVEEFELPVSSMELVQEIHQVLMDREDTCHRTCFSLQLDGQTLDNFAELKSIEGLKEGSVIKVVEEPYTIREARIHLRHIRDLLKSVDPGDAYAGVDCNSVSFLNIITAGDILEKKHKDSLDCTPPDYIMPGSKERPLLPLHPNIKELKTPPCLKVLTLSGWNPPPGNRKLHGDLIYLYAVTLEEKKYHITASTRGFYVNQCTEDVFNPKAAAQKFLSHTLIELLNQLSPAFKRNFSMLLKKRGQKHPFERVPTPYQVYTWMAPLQEHTVDYIRAEDAFSTRLGYEEHIPGQTRDWNEEDTKNERLSRILEREQEQSVVYGSIDFGKTVVTNDKYKELLQKSASQLKIRPHKVLNEKEEEVELYSSIECKGIVGNDQRHYVLDLLRTFPPDVNFSEVSPDELSNDMRNHGYPLKHRHKLCCLRQELVDAFVENRYVAFVRTAAYHFQQMQIHKKASQDLEKESKLKAISAATKTVVPGEKEKSDDKDMAEAETEEAKKIVEALTDKENQTVEESSKDIVKKAAKAVGSLSETEFNLTFNPDVFQETCQTCSAVLQKEKQAVKEAAEFLVLHQIPTLVNDCLDHSSPPIDGATLTEAMHTRGVNMRYLGKLAETVSKYKSVSYIYTICIAEMITRAAKHLYKIHMQGIDQTTLSAAISHFLNCLVGSFPTPHPGVSVDEGKGTRKKNKRRNKGIAISIDNTEWVNETPKSLWKKIIDEVDEYFHYTLECDSIDSAVEKYGIQKVSLLRSFCQCVGVQILLREYNLEIRSRAIFAEDDIVNVFPVVKHIHPRASDAYHFFSSGQSKIQQGSLKEGYDLICEALNLLNNVYGAMHPEIAACLRLLARLNYIMGDYPEAMSYQQRAVLMSERVLGIDHPNTITEYAHLALYCFANNQVSSALRLMYRTRYLALLCHGENHPETGLIDSNIGLILHAVEEYDRSLTFLEHALQLYQRFYGSKSLKVAMSYHLVARTHSCRGDFRAALNSEKEAYTIYRQMLGEEHERTKESGECLKHLTQQAVVFQKKMNEIVKGEKVTSLAGLQIQTPSMHSVMEMLNVINGIVFVQISPDEIERLRKEIGKKPEQKAGEKDSESKASDSGNESDNVNSPEKDDLAKTEKQLINGEVHVEEIAVGH
ncbi:clustered mitochondria protein homolog [Ruditapes philippinarum]|uniref:clustered mitochondria protein homolog n=1 Tax=Ruditapes philippinarum TaxID=129788 RepID=UPI00295B88B4|nr:clustered mitochondria protein homolog [Ruditapes philippinarum]